MSRKGTQEKEKKWATSEEVEGGEKQQEIPREKEKFGMG